MKKNITLKNILSLFIPIAAVICGIFVAVFLFGKEDNNEPSSDTASEYTTSSAGATNDENGKEETSSDSSETTVSITGNVGEWGMTDEISIAKAISSRMKTAEYVYDPNITYTQGEKIPDRLFGMLANRQLFFEQIYSILRQYCNDHNVEMVDLNVSDIAYWVDGVWTYAVSGAASFGIVTGKDESGEYTAYYVPDAPTIPIDPVAPETIRFINNEEYIQSVDETARTFIDNSVIAGTITLSGNGTFVSYNSNNKSIVYTEDGEEITLYFYKNHYSTEWDYYKYWSQFNRTYDQEIVAKIQEILEANKDLLIKYNVTNTTVNYYKEIENGYITTLEADDYFEYTATIQNGNIISIELIEFEPGTGEADMPQE